MILKVLAVKRVWFDIDINDLVALPENARTPFIEAKVREHMNNNHVIEYDIHSDFTPGKIPDTLKEKVIL